MNNMNKIARKIVGSQITVRELLTKKIKVNIIINTEDNVELSFSGPVELTPDGVARWGLNNILNIPLLLDDNEAIISVVLTHKQIQDLCSLFNTIAGHVNDDTYNKYIKN